MSFDRLAIHYPWMEMVFAGDLMQRCRTRFLSKTKRCRNALLVGEGTGKFLTTLLRLNPEIRVTCVEQSAGMIRQMQQRLRSAGLQDSRIEFKKMNALDWTPPHNQYDLVATHFFLDCFREEQLERLVTSLAGSTRPHALWLVTDFREPERGWRRWRAKLLLAMLFAFFKVTTRISASRLTPPDSYLTGVGFRLRKRRLDNFGFAHSDLWERIF
jgi:ubiquinone/menaquinone biosynthesis C-methylase UbiE